MNVFSITLDQHARAGNVTVSILTFLDEKGKILASAEIPMHVDIKESMKALSSLSGVYVEHGRDE